MVTSAGNSGSLGRMNARALLIAWTTSACLIGCLGGANYKVETSLQTGCDLEELTFSEKQRIAAGIHQWTATCPTGEFICTSRRKLRPLLFSGIDGPTSAVYDDNEISCRPSAAWDTSSANTAPVAPALQTPEPPLRVNPAKKMAGFVFGSRPEAAAQTCTGAGHKWTYNFHSGSCGGAAEDVGTPVSVELEFCEERVCTVTLVVPLHNSPAPEAELQRIRGTLQNSYGPPTQPTSGYPKGCENRFVECVTSQRMKYRDYWLLSQFRVTLEIRHSPSPAITIRYR